MKFNTIILLFSIFGFPDGMMLSLWINKIEPGFYTESDDLPVFKI